MECSQVKPGLRVRTVELGSTKSMIIPQEYLDIRREGITGSVLGHVPGHGGEVWFVQHDGSSKDTGAYHFKEVEPV